MICLISGKPNTGKSTALRKIADFLGIKRCAGLLAQEIMKEGERIGFSSRGLLCNEDIILAHKEFSKDHAVEDFGVDLKALEDVFEKEYEAALHNKDVSFFLIDEIGRMQVMSKRFCSLLDRIAESEKDLIATICYKDEIPYIRNFKQKEGNHLFILDESNRDELPLKIAMEVCKDDPLYLSKVKLAESYANQEERYRFEEGKVILSSTHGTRIITKENGIYHCTCEYYEQNGVCSHILSLLMRNKGERYG